MSDLSSLQRSVEAAREAHARAREQYRRTQKHLTSLINILDESLRERQDELAWYEVERERMTREYERLRHMRHELTATMEVGGADGLGNAPAETGAGMEARSQPDPVPMPWPPMPLNPAADDAASSHNEPAENGPAEIRPTEIGPTETGPTETGPTENGPTENGPTENGPTENGPTENGPAGTGPPAKRGDGTDDLRAGLRWMLKNRRSSREADVVT